MQTHILIVNRNGVFSSLPSEVDYKAGGYLDNPSQFFTYKVQISPDDLSELFGLRDRLMVIGPDMPLTHPEQITDIEHEYIEMKPYGAGCWSLQRVAIPEAAYLKVAKAEKLFALSNEEARGFSLTTSMFGVPRTFDSVTLNSLRSWTIPDEQTISLPSSKSGMTSVDAYNREQIGQLIALYDTERPAWHNSIMSRVSGVYQATSRFELSQIN